MRSFHETEGFDPPTQKLELPNNILLLATHGSREIPELTGTTALSEELLDKEFGVPRLKDYSDFGTGLIQEHFHPSSIVTPPRYGRIGGDANRELSASLTGDEGVQKGKETFRTTTMGGVIPVWAEGATPSKLERVTWLDESHRTYFEKIVASILSKLVETDKDILVVDLHDTGDVRLLPDGSTIPTPTRVEEYKRDTFWEAVLSDLEGKTSKPHVMNAMKVSLQDSYGARKIPNSSEEVRINDPYKGGYVTKFVGIELPEILKKWGMEEEANRINAIQLEVPRHRFMDDEQRQTIDPNKIKEEANLLHEILIDTSNSMKS